MTSTSEPVNYLTKALALFENDIPSQEVYTQEVLIPLRSLDTTQINSYGTQVNSQLAAISDYVTAYNGLKNNSINDACVMVLDDPSFKNHLPASLKLGPLFKLREKIINEAPVKAEATRREILKNESDNAIAVLTGLIKRLSVFDLKLDIDNQNGGLDIVVYDAQTGETITHDISDL